MVKGRPGRERGVPHPEAKRYDRRKGELILFSEKEILETGFEEPEMDTEHVTAEVKRIIEQPERYIDKGGAGKVYSFAPKVCVKVLEDRESSPGAEHMNLGNPVETEAAFQHFLHNMNVEGARVPKVYGYWKSNTPELNSSIIMEELNAVNAQHVFTERTQMPESFDLDAFFGALHTFMQDVHEKRRIIHGDMAMRNVMIDRESGLPRIIDFGRAKRLPKSDRHADRLIKQEFETIEDMYDQAYDYMIDKGLIEPLF